MKTLGVRNALISWIASYLKGRKQITKLGNVTSNLEDVNGGIPQCSKIGPLAFVIKINSLEQARLENDSNMVVIYMDDTTLSEILDVSQHGSGDQIGNMQEQLNSVTEWSKDQDMILNSKKCKEMIIDFRKKKTEIPELQAEQSPISRVSSYKLLGVCQWIDNNLKWETNTWALIKKGRKRLYFLKILKN
jgi:hypothetical protein